METSTGRKCKHGLLKYNNLNTVCMLNIQCVSGAMVQKYKILLTYKLSRLSVKE